MTSLYGRPTGAAPVFFRPALLADALPESLVVLDDNIPQPWRARSTLVLTLALVAVGLGNLQRLPYLIGEHGGGPFFLSYVVALCVLERAGADCRGGDW